VEPKVKDRGLAIVDKEKWCMKGDKREGPGLYQGWKDVREI